MSRRRKAADSEPVRLIREIAARHHRRYGSPRIQRELRDAYGKRASVKKVARLMRENGLNARRRRTFVRTTDSNRALAASENILSREFHAEKGGRKWVSDITYLRTVNVWVYLTVALGLYDQKGWEWR